MKKINENFFVSESEVGLTSSSANHLCNVSKEIAKQYQDEINRITFVNQSVSTLTADKYVAVKWGSLLGDLNIINDRLTKIAELNAFNAWFREAIKAKDEASKLLMIALPIEEKCKILGIEVPYPPVGPGQVNLITKQDVLDSLSIKDRNKIFALEARASTIGKYINPRDGAFYNARVELSNKVTTPVKLEGHDSSLVVHSFTASVDSDIVNAKFQELQNIHRETEAELNGLLANINRKVQEENAKITLNATADAIRYKQDYQKMSNEMNTITSLFNEYLGNEMKRINGLKLAIPKDLEATFKFLSSTGKKA